MNSNTPNQSSSNSTLQFFTSSISIYTLIIPHITNPIYNPTIVDFD